MPFRLSLGAWLLIAFVTVALLPAVIGVPGWLGSRSIQAPLQQVAAVVETFGTHDRAFRQNIRNLYGRIFVSRNFSDRASFDRTVALVQGDLAGMSASIHELAGSNLVPASADYVGMQTQIEEHTASYLALIESQLALREERRHLIQGSASQLDRIVDLSRDPRLLAGDSSVGHVADIVSSAAAIAELTRNVPTALTDELIESLRDEMEKWHQVIDASISSLAQGTARNELSQLSSELAGTVLDGDGLLAIQSRANALVDAEFEDRTALRADVLDLIARLVEEDIANDEAVGELLAASGNVLAEQNRALLVTIIVGTSLALVVVVWFVYGNVLRRLRRLTLTTRRLTSGELGEAVAERGDDELGELGQALETFRLSALELRRSRSELAKKSDDLEQVNSELDQFAYIASHDLKAPLRAIASLAGFLREDLEETMTAETRKNLDMMQGRVERLDALLDSLLEYSRAGRAKAPAEVIELRQLLEEATDVVTPRDAQVSLRGSFGNVVSHPAPLEQVVRNLVDNAFKHNDGDCGLVTIDCDIVGNAVRLEIADNGPGIAPEFHDRVFGMFQTLKPRDHVEGSGMGLSIIRKLIESFGGTIHLASDPAVRRGATFTVTWPVEAVLRKEDCDVLDTGYLGATAATA